MAGRFGSPVRQMTCWMFAEGLVANVASDAHDAVRRPPGLRAGFDHLDEMLPGLAEQADWYTRAAPAAMLAGQALPDRPDPPRLRRSVTRLLNPLARSRR
jgi:tyrosine-protein phosphatase YwqE